MEGGRAMPDQTSYAGVDATLLATLLLLGLP